jgi:metal-responsive CopG/Arc/MetJ family transcriptional regulator
MPGRGRPSTGVAINTRIPQELLDEIDRLAAEHGVARAEMIRALLREAVERKRQGGLGPEDRLDTAE